MWHVSVFVGGKKVLHNLKCVNESIISSPCHPFGVCYRRQPILVECQMCDALECARDIDGTVQILRQEPELSVFRANANADIGGKKNSDIDISANDCSNAVNNNTCDRDM